MYTHVSNTSIFQFDLSCWKVMVMLWTTGILYFYFFRIPITNGKLNMGTWQVIHLCNDLSKMIFINIYKPQTTVKTYLDAVTDSLQLQGISYGMSLFFFIFQGHWSLCPFFCFILPTNTVIIYRRVSMKLGTEENIRDIYNTSNKISSKFGLFT